MNAGGCLLYVGMQVVAFWDGDGDGFSLGRTGTLGTGWTSFAPSRSIQGKYAALITASLTVDFPVMMMPGAALSTVE